MRIFDLRFDASESNYYDQQARLATDNVDIKNWLRALKDSQ